MTAEQLRALIPDELRQRAEEGCATEPIEALWADLKDQPADTVATELEALLRLLERLPSPTEANEPSTLPEIRALCPEGPRVIELSVDRVGLRDKLLGALLGRVAGCQLGKPVEGWPKAWIDEYLAFCGETELRDWFVWTDPAAAGPEHRPYIKACCRGYLRGAERDDDQDYTLLGLLLLEQRGAAVTAAEVAEGWFRLLPYHQTYTAERVAYRNLVNGLTPPTSAWYRNPYREWIGAQIRCDGWAYASPGRPRQAAELAFRDATVSHVKNGIYGEMYFAAAIAAAFATDDLEAALRVGLTEIPADCRLAECVRDMLAWRAVEPTWRGCWERLNAKYGHYHGVHTINNAALVLLGLLYGEGDLGATIGIAVHGGWDTDCNGATAGSLLGALLGARNLPGQWTEPLANTVRSALFGYAENRLDDLAELALKLAGTVRLPD